MSDETHEDHPGSCTTPGCVYHAMSNAKVRAIRVDDETYVNINDVVPLITNWHEYQTLMMRDNIESEGPPDEVLGAIEAALMNGAQGAMRALSFLASMAELKIASDLNDITTPLVTPEATKIAVDTVPAEWAEKEKQ